ncbi:hypothetical protein ABW19_dt0204515 [Dactylella cylindrospora]|nr:hypothetical protein ABW19_dt0204515 [Dactylella cylindrospora]
MPTETSSAAQTIKSNRSGSSTTGTTTNIPAIAPPVFNAPTNPTANTNRSENNNTNENVRISSTSGQLSNRGSVNMISGHTRSLSNPVNKTTAPLGDISIFPPPKPLMQPGQTNPPTSTSGFPHPPQAAPFTPTRPSLPRGLSLQLPNRNQPLPPYLDPALGFSTVRRPRLDFTRSCTSLHHSFVADSPDSSPLTPSMPIPRRGLDSPIAMYTSGAGSILSNMLADSHVQSDESSDSSSDDDEMELNSAHSQFGPSLPGSSMNDMFSSSGLLNRRHMTRLRGKGSSRQSSSSASASSTSLASPSPTTPPNGETKKPSGTGGYFGSQLGDMLAQRRQSISQAMKKIGFAGSSGASDDGKGEATGGRQLDAIRRPVTRRGNLLPKPKHFQRVKAALIEESAPIDAEMRIEAAIQRQLREEDDEEDHRTVPQTPVLQAQAEDDQPLVFEDTEDESNGMTFKSAAQRNSGYWGSLESSSPGGFVGFKMNPDGDIIVRFSIRLRFFSKG